MYFFYRHIPASTPSGQFAARCGLPAGGARPDGGRLDLSRCRRPRARRRAGCSMRTRRSARSPRRCRWGGRRRAYLRRFRAALRAGPAATALGSLILFLIWFYRANANVRAMGADGLMGSPGLAVAWFFIPIAFLFMPYRDGPRHLEGERDRRATGRGRPTDPRSASGGPRCWSPDPRRLRLLPARRRAAIMTCSRRDRRGSTLFRTAPRSSPLCSASRSMQQNPATAGGPRPSAPTFRS